MFLPVLVLDQFVCGFDFLQPIRLMFLLCLCWIREYVDLISCNPLETDVLAVLVLDQGVRGFDSCKPIGD
jgi:hypothetical protein